ncbi:hypothetical protein ACJX0J_038965, partial [Zea mays]
DVGAPIASAIACCRCRNRLIIFVLINMVLKVYFSVSEETNQIAFWKFFYQHALEPNISGNDLNRHEPFYGHKDIQLFDRRSATLETSSYVINWRPICLTLARNSEKH